MLPQRLIFVYNADGGRLAGLKDLFHKILSPATYSCSLCAVPYGPAPTNPKAPNACAALGAFY